MTTIDLVVFTGPLGIAGAAVLWLGVLLALAALVTGTVWTARRWRRGRSAAHQEDQPPWR